MLCQDNPFGDHLYRTKKPSNSVGILNCNSCHMKKTRVELSVFFSEKGGLFHMRQISVILPKLTIILTFTTMIQYVFIYIPKRENQISIQFKYLI